MSIKDYKNKKLAKAEARKLVSRLASAGRVILSNHGRIRLIERNIIMNDVMNVLLSSDMRISDGEFGNNGYSYRCSTNRFNVVVGFTVQGDGVVIVTVFKAERKK